MSWNYFQIWAETPMNGEQLLGWGSDSSELVTVVPVLRPEHPEAKLPWLLYIFKRPRLNS